MPFGEGVLTLPQRSDHALSIWGREKVEKGDTAEPVARFEGAREGVKEFVWRTRGPSSLDNGQSWETDGLKPVAQYHTAHRRPLVSAGHLGQRPTIETVANLG